MNGTSQQEPREPPVIAINAGLNRRDLIVLVTAIGGLVSTLVTGGYIFWPAKQDDVDKIRGDLVVIARDIGKIKSAVQGLSLQIDSLIQAGQRGTLPALRRPPARAVAE